MLRVEACAHPRARLHTSAGQDDPTGAAALRVAVWERQKALKDDMVGSVIGPDIQLSTLLVSKAVWPDVQSLLDEEDSPCRSACE